MYCETLITEIAPITNNIQTLLLKMTAFKYPRDLDFHSSEMHHPCQH